MREPDNADGRTLDPLAEIVRAAGRREPPPSEHYDQVYAAAHSSWQRKLRSRRNHRWFAAAASVAVLTAGGLVAYLVQTGDAGAAATVAIVQGAVELQSADSASWERIPGGGQVVKTGMRLRTSAGGQAALELTEGGSLRLGAGTELRFGYDIIELAAGTVYFDSAGRNESMPIQIATSFGRVLDVGTRFEVSLIQDSLRVRVRGGKVVVLESQAADDIQAAIGEQIQITAQGLVARSSIAPDDPDYAWVEMLASVPASQTQSILTYLQWIARETGKQLQFESGNLELAAELGRFGGDPAGLSPRELLSSIADTSDFRYSLTTDGAILIGRNQVR